MKKRTSKIMLLVLALISFGFINGTKQAFADNEEIGGNGLIVSPTSENIILEPGKTVTNTIKVSNGYNATEAYKYKISIGPFSAIPDDTEYRLDTTSVTNYNQLMDWITIDQTEGYVQPNEVVEVPYTITVPKDAPGGGQYATIKVQRVNEKQNTGGVGIMEEIEIGCLLYATITGKSDTSGAITGNNIAGFYLQPPIQAETFVKNNGNVHQIAKYSLQVFPLFSDEEIYTNVEKPKQATILPGQSYTFIHDWDETPMFGIFNVRSTVEFAGQISVSEKMIVICPIWLLFIVIFAIVAIIIYFVMKSKSRKNSRKRVGAE